MRTLARSAGKKVQIMATLPNKKPVFDPFATASYLAAIAAELAALAERNRLPVVAYLLGMARMEAETVARQLAGRPPDGSR
jgi:hypothetical protein